MLHTSSPWSAVTDETRDALAQISAHGSLLSDEWRARLDDAHASLERVGEDERGVLAVRAARAAAVIAAGESAQAARFEARLVALSPSELDRVQSELEALCVWLEQAQSSSVAHLEGAAADLVAEFRAEVALAWPRASTRSRHLLAQDLASVLRTHGDRSEELLLELGEAACARVGVAMGGLLPLRACHVLPALDLGDDADPSQIEATMAATVASYRDNMSPQLASVMRRLRAAMERARERQRAGRDAADERIGALSREARELDGLALRLDWMPTASRTARTEP